MIFFIYFTDTGLYENKDVMQILSHLLTFSNSFMHVRVSMDPEPFTGTPGEIKGTESYLFEMIKILYN